MTDIRPEVVLAQPTLLDSVKVLLRLRVAAMVALMAALGAALAPVGGWLEWLEAALAVTLVTGSASIFNQVLERETDALMERTAQRPLVTGAMPVAHAVYLAFVLGAAGTALGALRFNLLFALLLLATLLTYVAVYTPLKRVSTLNTVVGAVAGAAPPLLGYVALAGDIGPWAWCLFAILFAWQFPHFMAIAWLYREDYARAGHKMVPSVPDSDGDAGRQALLYGLVMVPIALLPVTRGIAGPVYGVGSVLAGLMYLWPSIRFARREDRPRARALVLVSLVYLPLIVLLVAADPVSRAVLFR